ncbi:MAG: DUF4388 domain-containing protein, partial [Polyangiaceae bacterium]
GEVGTVQWLHLASADRARRVHVMAHLVRNVAPGERPSSDAAGVALEFMPESDERTEELHDFVRYVLSNRFDIPSGAPTVRQLSAGRLSLYSRWAIAIGEVVRVEIVAPGVPQPILLRGRAVHVAAAGDDVAHHGQHRIEVELEEEREGPLRRLSSATFRAVKAVPPPDPVAPPPEDEPDPFPGTDLSSTLDEMLSALVTSSETLPRRAHLSGLLTRGRLPMLAALFDMERISGELTLSHGAERSRLFVQRGRIIDLEPLGPSADVRTELARLFGWTEGSFEFVIREIDRPDRIEATVNAILLDLARRADEASRDHDSDDEPCPPEAIDSI